MRPAGYDHFGVRQATRYSPFVPLVEIPAGDSFRSVGSRPPPSSLGDTPPDYPRSVTYAVQ